MNKGNQNEIMVRMYSTIYNKGTLGIQESYTIEFTGTEQEYLLIKVADFWLNDIAPYELTQKVPGVQCTVKSRTDSHTNYKLVVNDMEHLHLWYEEQKRIRPIQTTYKSLL